MTIDLRIVGRFIAGEITPGENTADHDQDSGDDQTKPHTGIAQGGAPSLAKVALRRGVGFAWPTPGIGFPSLWFPQGFGALIHDYLPFK